MSLAVSLSNSSSSSSSRALVAVDDKAAFKSRSVVLLSDDPYRPKRPRRAPSTVLDEDAYVDALQTIIERDFYPDLPRIRTKLRWMEAKERGDVATMREIQRQFGSTGSFASSGGVNGGGGGNTTQRVTRTPAQLQTPSAGATQTATATTSTTAASTASTSGALDNGFDGGGASLTLDRDGNPVDTTLSLDKFVANYTSEDNKSYEELADTAHLRFRERYRYLVLLCFDLSSSIVRLLFAPFMNV